jgi:protocatechuate 3,4-dioxygenase beta subunit
LRSNDDFRYQFTAALVVCAAVVLLVFTYGTITSGKPGTSQPFVVGQSGTGVGHTGPGSTRTNASHAAQGSDAASLARTVQRTAGPVEESAAGKQTPRGAAALGSAAQTPPADQAKNRSGEPTPAAQATNGAHEPTPAADDPRNDLAISGRVLDQDKQPVPGIDVTARKSPSQPNEAADAGAGRSGPDGRYEIRGLTEGEYAIRTVATPRYRAGEIVAQAGFTSADIILEGDYEIRVYGTVTDTDGQPLAGVRVVPADLQRETRTDSNGNYQAFLVVNWKAGTYAFQFQLRGYRDKLVYLTGADVDAVQEKRVDAQLESAGDTTTLNGSVRAEDGSPVAGATVQLQSDQSNTHYNGLSRNDGRFSIPEVRTASDYRVTVLATAGYKDYTEAPVAITSGLPLDIVLESLKNGQLTGRMVDTEGRPIPRFSLWLTSANARAQTLPVSSDDSGSFVVDQAPAGILTFATRSVPALVVSGITLGAGDQQNVSLVLDWGDLVLAGRVTDDRDDPVARAQVSLAWSEQIGALRSSSTRTTPTGAGGEFQFTQLGPGPHVLSITVPGSGVPQSREVPAGTRQFDVQVPVASQGQ